MKLFIFLRLSGFTLKFVVIFYKVSRKVNISYSFAGDWGRDRDRDWDWDWSWIDLGLRRIDLSLSWIDRELIVDKVDLWVSVISLKFVISVWCFSGLRLPWRSGRCASTRLIRETTSLFCRGLSFCRPIPPVSSRTHRTVQHHDCSVRHLFGCMF